MTIKSIDDRPVPDKVEIDLTGPDGNAFALMAYVRRLARPLGLDSKKIIEEMMECENYDALLDVFDKYLGDYVTLYR